MNRRTAVLLLAALLLGGLVTPPGAQEPAAPPPEVRMEEVEIKGEVERPGVFYIIPRREVELDRGRQHKDFAAQIAEPLDPLAFEHWVRQRTNATP